jgi:aspartyl/asparaginyl-tRNA synthetase
MNSATTLKDAANYPIQGRPSLERLRELPHLRPRTNIISAMLRVRSALDAAVHDYFDANQFFQIHTPVLTRCVPACGLRRSRRGGEGRGGGGGRKA